VHLFFMCAGHILLLCVLDLDYIALSIILMFTSLVRYLGMHCDAVFLLVLHQVHI